MTCEHRGKIHAGLAVMRAVNGGLMAGHGLQKLTGWFGGGGLEATAAGFEHMGLAPGRRNAILAGATETVAGATMLLGAFTPLASAATTGLMTVAIKKVHGPNGLWVTKGGFEYNLTIIGAAFALAELGPGAFALDGTLFKRRAGLRWAVAEFALGVGTAIAVIAVSDRSGTTSADDDDSQVQIAPSHG